MEQFYALEIVIELLKSNNYVRGIAKNLNINHMTILRKIKFLFKNNVIDYKEEGKNKVYFLKKNAESKAFVFMAEFYKLIQILKKYPQLRRGIEKIQNDNRFKLAVLFGSFAKCRAKKDSDIDIFIDTQDRKIKQDLESFDSKLSVKIGSYNKKSFLIKEIEKNHVLIKGVEEFYEKNKFFE